MSKTYAELASNFARVRALILQILNKHPEGLTYNQVGNYFWSKHGYRPRTDNRLRELVKEGLATKRVVGNRMRFFSVLEEGLVNHQSCEVP